MFVLKKKGYKFRKKKVIIYEQKQETFQEKQRYY